MKYVHFTRVVLAVSFAAGLTQCQQAPQEDAATAEPASERITLQPAAEYSYTAAGKEYVTAAFGALSSQLKAALQEGGPTHAISFCNERALPLTDSLSKHYGVQIKRVSNKYRNPANKANEYEVELIDKYAVRSLDGQELLPDLFYQESSVVAYYPIQMGGLCLTCHGAEGTEVTAEVGEALAKHYPNDLAKGYAVGDIRGLWAVEMPKKQ